MCISYVAFFTHLQEYLYDLSSHGVASKNVMLSVYL